MKDEQNADKPYLVPPADAINRMTSEEIFDVYERFITLSLRSANRKRTNAGVDLDLQLYVNFGEPSRTVFPLGKFGFAFNKAELWLEIENGVVPLEKIRVHEEYTASTMVESEQTDRHETGGTSQDSASFSYTEKGTSFQVSGSSSRSQREGKDTRRKTTQKWFHARFEGSANNPRWIFEPVAGRETIRGYFNAEPLATVEGWYPPPKPAHPSNLREKLAKIEYRRLPELAEAAERLIGLTPRDAWPVSIRALFMGESRHMVVRGQDGIAKSFGPLAERVAKQKIAKLFPIYRSRLCLRDCWLDRSR